MKSSVLKVSVFAMFFAGPISAATIVNDVSILDGQGGLSVCGSSGFLSASGETRQELNLNDGGVNCTVASEAYADVGVVGIRSTVTANTYLGTGSFRNTISAQTRLRNIYITPTVDVDLDDPPLAPEDYRINVTLNGALSGFLSGAAENSNAQGVGSASLTARATLSGAFAFGSNSTSDTVRVDASASAQHSGLLSAFDNFGQSMMPTILQDWRLPMTVSFDLDTRTSAGGFEEGNIFTGSLDAFNSLGFSTTGPAFILPDGFTVNAPELNIVNNQWIDPRAAPVVPAVPLPAGLPMLLSGLVGFAALKRRRKI